MRVRNTHSSKIQPVIVALISFAYFAIVVLALYFLNPAYSLLNSMAGNYAISPYEFHTATTFFSFGLGSLALAVGLYKQFEHSISSVVGFIFLIACGVGMLTAGVFPANEGGSTVPHVTTALVAGIFPVQVNAVPETTFSFIHILAIIGSLFSLSLAALLLSWRFNQYEKWHPIYKPTLISAIAMTAISILFCSVLLHPDLVRYFRLINPIILVVTGMAVGLFWLSIVTGRLYLIGANTLSE